MRQHEVAAIDIQWPEGLTTELFLDQYWQRRPLLIPQAFANFNNPLDPDELAGLACDADVSARFMEQQQDGQWRMCHGPFDDEFFAGVSGNQWSVLVSDVEKLLPDFQSWLQPFRFLPDWRIDDLMISYAPVGGSVGAHVDQYDVFLLQADGARDWHIENQPRESSTDSISSAISLLSDFSADQTMRLRAGDMLYLPPGFAHHGVAVEEPCMTWSVGFRAPTAAELLPAVLHNIGETAQAAKRFADPSRPHAIRPGQITPTDLQQLRALLRQALEADDQTLDHWISCALTSGTDAQSDDDPAVDSTPASSLMPNSYKRFLYTVNDDSAQLYIDGQMFQCSIALAAAICDQRLLPAELLEAIDSRDRALINTFAAKELLVPCDDRQH